MSKIPSAGIVALTFLLLFANPTSAQWVRTNGPHYEKVSCLAATGSSLYAGTFGFYGTLCGAFRTVNNGLTWEAASSGLTIVSSNMRVSCIVATPNFLLAGIEGGGICRSTDEGANWVAASAGLAPPNQWGYLPSPNALVLSGSTFYAGIGSNGYGGGFYYSTNGGISWVAANTGLTDPLDGQPLDVYALAVADSATIYAGTGRGVYKSTNGGVAWKFSGLSDGMVYSLAASGPYVYANYIISGGPSGHYFYSTNGGLNWSQHQANPRSWESSLAIAGRYVFGATIDGVFRLNLDGSGWIDVSSGLPPGAVVGPIVLGGETLYAGVSDSCVWRRPLLEVTGVEDQPAQVPIEMELSQNYPNPFNPSALIKYSVGGVRGQGPGVSKIRLAVYDLLGREVAVLVDEPKAPGSYEVRFDATTLSSGAYFYRLTAGGFAQTRTMMLIR